MQELPEISRTAMIETLPQHSAAAFVASRGSENIVIQLRINKISFKKGQSCSWVALYAPASRTHDAAEIAQCLSPSPKFTIGIQRVLYENLISRLRRYLNGRGIFATQHEIDKATRELQTVRDELSPNLTSECLRVALEIFEFLQDSGIIGSEATANEVCSIMRHHIVGNESTIAPDDKDTARTEQHNLVIPVPPTVPWKRLCYICRLSLTVPYSTQPAMYMPCGSFNLASSRISEPSTLTLPATFNALVTDARINLGYHTTLRLLRCGARVLTTTRYL